MRFFPGFFAAAILLVVFSGCKKKKEASVITPVAPKNEESALAAPTSDAVASAPQTGSSMKGLEALSTHSNPYIRNNAVEALTQWKSKNYLEAAVAFQAMASLVRGEQEQTVLFSSFGPFQREARTVAQAGNRSAKSAVEFMDQNFGPR